MDAVVETPCGIYVFEFKLGSGGAARVRALPSNGAGDGRASTPGSPSLAEQALAQIKAKGYHESLNQAITKCNRKSKNRLIEKSPLKKSF